MDLSMFHVSLDISSRVSLKTLTHTHTHTNVESTEIKMEGLKDKMNNSDCLVEVLVH